MQDKFKPTLLVELRTLVLLQPVGELHAGNRQIEDQPARAAGLSIVTANVSEFARVPGLAVYDWLGE